MRRRVPRSRLIISYGVLFLAFCATAARAIFLLSDTSDVWYVAAAMGIYLLILVVESFLITRNLAYLHVINALQTGITLALLVTVSQFDLYSLLFIPICGHKRPAFSTQDRLDLDRRDLPADGRPRC